MNAFFSGTDLKELEDNAKSYNFYISLVVSTDEKYVCKIIFPSETTSVHEHLIRDLNGNVKKVTKEIKERVLIDADLDVVLNRTEVPEWVSNRIKEVEDKKEANKPKSWNGYNRHYNGNQLGLPFGFEDDVYSKPVLPSETYKSNLKSKDSENFAKFIKNLLYLDESTPPSSTINDAIKRINELSKEDIEDYVEALVLNIDIIMENTYGINSHQKYYDVIDDIVKFFKGKKQTKNIQYLLKVFEEELKLID